MSKVDKTEINAQIAASIKNFSLLAKDEASRQRIVIDMPDYIRTKAQLISAHFLLPAGARVADMGCETGEVTYMLAVLNPRAEFIGYDIDAAAVEFARRTYRLPNLSFEVADAAIPHVADGTLDGIVNSNMLHHIYSQADYDAAAVSDLLEKQIGKLKTGGTMLVRDHVKPPDDEFVLMELPDAKGGEDTTEGMSDADLLVAFSQTARPMAAGCEGFFIEVLAPRRAGTRLFRLPHKWAMEFVHRKDYRAGWDSEIKSEYTFYTWHDYRREFTRLGMRMAFSAPYWNPWVVNNCFKGRFQMYAENGDTLPPPPTNHFIVAQKVADRQSLILEERRPSQKPAGDLQIMVVRDKKTGALHELVKRPGEYCDVVPYRITSDNRLVIYVRSGYPRPIVNAVLRGSHNLDGKKWSGHLIEPVTMDTVDMTDDVEENRRMIFDYVRGYTGLRPKSEDGWYVGDTYFPSPDRIDEAIEPVFIEVENPQKTSWPIQADKDVGFTELGTITELDATDVILASQVGLLPEPRLEMHVFDLMSRYGIPFPRWIGEEMPKLPGQPVRTHDPEDLLKELPPAEFEEVKAAPAQLRAVRSVFVEEGRVGRGTRGLSSQDVEFIVSDDGVENIAVVVPLSRDWDNNLLVAMEPRVMPVPNRLGGSGAMLSVPSFVLPRDVRSVTDAKMHIAQKFRVPPEQVGRLGESYFTHTGVTPQRVYPFVVSAPGDASNGPKWRYAPIKRLWRLLFMARYAADSLKALARIQMMMPEGHGMTYNRSPVTLNNHGSLSLSTEKVAVEARNAGYAAPSRILGQRGAAGQQQPGVDADALQAQTIAAQAAVEELAAPRIGKRLTQSYAQALNIRESLERIDVQQTAAVAEVDRHIDALRLQIERDKTRRADPPVLEPAAPGRKA